VGTRWCSVVCMTSSVFKVVVLNGGAIFRNASDELRH
jgi:hypothetical protein